MPVGVERVEAPTVRREAGDGYAPLLRCDACGKEIPKPAAGRVAWQPEENATYLTPVFLHEGCLEDYRKGTRERVWDDRLDNFIDSLRRFL